ncbi:MAG: hypothetical protein ACTHU1_09780, partial [Arachnia sp.]
MSIVVLTDLFDVEPDQALSLVRAGATLGEVTCVLGAEPDTSRIESLGAAGATRLVWTPLPTDGRTSATVSALAAAAGSSDPVLIPATRTGNQVAARLALQVKRELSVAADSILRSGDGLTSTLTAFSGTWNMVVELSGAPVVTATAAADGPAPTSGVLPTVEALKLDSTTALPEPE